MLRTLGGVQASSRFHWVRSLGSGSFGAVWEATDLRTGQVVAVKRLHDTRAESIARFKHEFRALTGCHHPNLVGLKELIEESGSFLIVMELVPGSDLLEAVRRPPSDAAPDEHGFDEGRLRAALTGVAEGLRALHGFGVLHRDLKPSNVRVRADGRAVLLDFGLATSIDAGQQSTNGIAVGTVRYMAPEQISRAVGPAADVYALGVCLFEALTGQAPFEGEQPLQILLAKQQRDAPLASSLNPRVPADLDALCAELLATAPEQRPPLDEVLRVLGGSPLPRAEHVLTAAHGSHTDLFAGRETELAHLERALARTHRGELRIVLVEGESGIGKSELVAEFMRRARTQHPTLTALAGRCYENEQVPYKAFDGCIDELARLLKRMPKPECAALMPVRAGVLGQLFPVLRNVESIAQATLSGTSADPTARRLEAFGALAALLNKLAEDRPLVLVVDDLQWADAESFRLLLALVEATERPPLLLVATVRPREELEPEALAHIETVRTWKHTDVMQLFGLPRGQAVGLAAKLLGPEAPAYLLDVIADESDGHPLFLQELVQYTERIESGARGGLTLDAALRSRVERLDWRARELLELVALAARPHGSHVFARALAHDVDEPARLLLGEKLLKLRKGSELGCYHDRIRRAVVELIARTRVQGLHYQLAAALSSAPDADAADQARHWDLAGQRERAVAAYELAVTRALDTLAFTRAAQLCTRALELVDSPEEDAAQRLTVRHAHALACAGKSAEAALRYQQAAEGAQGETRIRLRSRAAQQLMLSTKVVEGFDAARSLLAELGVHVPATALGSLLRIAWDRLCLSLRPEPQAYGAQSAPPSLALQVLDELVYVISVSHPLGALALSIRSMRLLKGSNAMRARGYSARGWLAAVNGSLAAALPLFERSRVLIEGCPPTDAALRAYTEGSARLATWDWEGAGACLEQAQKLLEEHCHDRPWQLTQVRYHLGTCWYHQGEHRRLASATETWLAEARERNDHLGIALIAGMGAGFARHLMRDAPEAALSELDDALALLPLKPLSFARFGQLLGKGVTLVYQGGPAALRWLDAFEQENRGEFLLRTRLGEDVRLLIRGVATLSAYASANAEERPALLRQTERAVRTLERRPSAYAEAQARLLKAQVEALLGERGRALQTTRAARALFDGMQHGNARGALYLEGLLEGGAAGRAKQASSLEAMRAQGWCDPLRGLCMAVPALSQLAEPKRSAPASGAKLLLGRYEVLTPLAGGFGSMTIARDVHSDRRLILKELVQQDGPAIERFKQEFRAREGVHHENLARVDTLFEDEGRWYIAMELVEGSTLLAYVRPAGSCDPARVQSAFLGLARGLAALHEAGFVHLDLTPDQVRVAPDGRPVLLAFERLARAGVASEDSTPLRTPAYAAPEQLRGSIPGASTDVYRLGACLHEALFGEPPRSAGSPAELALKPPQMVASSPAAARDMSALATLCRRMLAPTAEARPLLAEVVAELGGLEPQASRGPHSRPPPDSADRPAAFESPFAGREEELARLAEAFERTCEDGLTVALVEGESGVGKSALVAAFAERLKRRWPSLEVLTSRCYESELLPLKAFDGIADQLAHVLRCLPNPSCEALLPRRAALLGQLFPVLNSVPAIAHASRKGLPAEAAARQLAARACFVELLEQLSGQRELLFVVDDLQWADSESFALLRTLVGNAKRLPMFVLCTVRESAEVDAQTASEIANLRALTSTENVSLAGLGSADAARLAEQLHGGPLDPVRLAAVVAESRGHPLFLRELVEHEREGTGRAARPGLTLDEALRARVESFSPEARELLSLVALSGRPLGAHVYARAMERELLPHQAVIALLGHGVLRRGGENQLACYHDRIRRTVLEGLTGERLRTLAERLARALEQERGAEAAERARLWDEAGEARRAFAAYEEAGERALQSLAFLPAAQHYERALALLAQLGSEDDEHWRHIVVARGHALAGAGQSAEAARMFQLAATSAEGESQVRLRLLSAQHLLQGGQVTEGMGAARALLNELGLAAPEGERAALARIAWERARLALHGTALKPRRRASGRSERLVLEALRGLSSPVREVSYLTGSTLVAQYLRRALLAGEPDHTARALAYEGVWRTVRAPASDQSALFEQSQALAASTGDPALIAEVELSRGLACLASNQFSVAPAHLALAHELLHTRCPKEPWLLTAARVYLGAAWFYGGDFAALTRAMGPWLDEARARDDRHALAALCGFGRASVRHLIGDRPAQATEELAAAMATWPEEPFSTVHFGVAITSAHILGYSRGGALLEWLEQHEGRWKRAFLMRTPACRFSIGTFKAWALTLSLRDRSDPEVREVLARLRLELQAMRDNPAHGVSGIVTLHLGLVRLLEGHADDARRAFGEAAAELTRVGHYYGVGARYLEGALEGGAGGREKQRLLLETIQAEGWADPMLGLSFRTPGVHLVA